MTSARVAGGRRDKSMTAAEILAKVKPAHAAVRMCVNGELAAERDLLVDDLDQIGDWAPSGLSDVDPRAELRKRLDVLEQQMREETVVFRFRNVGDKAWSDLLAAHPAREGKDDEENWDSTTFPAALIAAAAVEPELTLADAEALLDAFTLAQRNTLFATAWSANTRGLDIPFLFAPSDAEE